MRRSPPAALIAGPILLAIYIATLAPDITWWDSGELISAAHSLGIPHPPGVPLYVLLSSVSLRMFGWMGHAAAAALLSALSIALSGAVCAHIVEAVSGSRRAAVGAALCAGGMFTVWSNATEAEVYAPAMCLAVLMLASAFLSARESGRRWFYLTAYLMALSGPLHLTALVAAPAAIVLASLSPALRIDGARAVLLCGVMLASMGLGKGSLPLAGAGAAIIASVPAARLASARRLRYQGAPAALACFALVAVAASCLAYLPVRAAWDPAINQGNPESLEVLLRVLRREQYDVAGFLPRQAPVWIQLSNYLQYLDWQFALGLSPDVYPNVFRTLACVLFLVLAGVGMKRLGESSRQLRIGVLVLLACSTLGVIAYLNLKAGPTIGYGILADGTPHEARERDYFFLLSFWTLGLLAGAGAVHAASRLRRGSTIAALLLASVPLLLNLSASNRRLQPEAGLPLRLARALLEPLADSAVLFVAGDNDSYPLWYLQRVRAVRRDVTVVTVPLLGAGWYRRELARRYGLASSRDTSWKGLASVLREIADSAEQQGRPLSAAVSLDADERGLIAPSWTFTGFHFVAGSTPAAGAQLAGGDVKIDLERVRESLRWADSTLARTIRRSVEPMHSYGAELLRCPFVALAAFRDPASEVRLDSTCNFR